MADSDAEVENELQHQLAFGRYTDYISEECLNEIYRIKNNQPVGNNEFLLTSSDARQFTDQAWKLLGRYIANNTHLEKIDLESCRLTDEKMTLLFKELVRSSSLQILLLSDNEFSIDGVRNMVPLLQNSPNISRLFMGGSNINTDCFELVISSLAGKSIEVLLFTGCNIGDISALSTYNLPCLHTLNLSRNSIGREGCITLSNLLQKEGSTLKTVYLSDTGIDDEGADILAAALKHNTNLRILNLEANNNITEKGGIAILKVLIDVSSIENTYNSNNTLSLCYLGHINNVNNRLRSLICGACKMNEMNNPGRAKVIKYHLNSQAMKELCELQGIEYIPGNIFKDIEPVLLPRMLSLIGRSQGHREFYRALIHTAPDLLSHIDRRALINDKLAKVEARGIALSEEIAVLIARREHEMANLNAEKADLSSRLALIDLGDIKQSASRNNNGVAESSKKRQRS